MNDDSMYRLLVQSVTDFAIYLLTLDGHIRSWNAGAQRAKGYTAEQILGQHFSVFYTREDQARNLPQQALQAALETGIFEGEGWRVRQDGSHFFAHVVLQPVQDEAGKTIGFAKITRDITQQKQRETRAAEQEQSFRLLVQGVTDYAIYMLAPDGMVTNWNAGAERAKGYKASEVVGQHFSRFYTPEDRHRGLPERALATALGRGKYEGEGWRMRKDGSCFWAYVVIHPIRDDAGTLLGFAKITRDVTERKKIQDQVSHLAHHDALTGLLNRGSFRDTVRRTLAQRRPCAVLYLDLDRFKPINDALGHLVGDKVLKIVAERIGSLLRKTDAAGRLGGDEFAVLLHDAENSAAAHTAAARLIEEIAKPMLVDNLRVSVGVSVGMAFNGQNVCSTELLLRNADLALYAAKREGRGTCRAYEPEMESVLSQRKALENDLRLALVRNEFSLHYQPIVSAGDDHVTGYEALIRWHSPTRGPVSPADFIPFAEENALMAEIGDWVLLEACSEAARWPQHLSVAVNLSPTQFRSPYLVQKIAETLKKTGLSPTRLELEITETAMLGDLSTAQDVLMHLRNMGIKVALDDFGTGYSSLSYLRVLPFTRIKIDRSFIQDLGKTKESLAIVRAVTGLCSSLGVATTAEGVETAEQLSILRHEGCQDLQGYLLGRPVPYPQQQTPAAPLNHPVQTHAVQAHAAA